MNTNIGFIGAGCMGTAIIEGLIKSNYSPDSIYVSDPNSNKRKRFAHLNIQNEQSDNKFVVENSDIIFLCVKPQMIESVCKSIQHLINPKRHIFISIAAGISLKKLEEILKPSEPAEQNFRIVRCMLNIAALIGSSCSVYSLSGNLSEQDKSIVEQLLSSTGPW